MKLLKGLIVLIFTAHSVHAVEIDPDNPLSISIPDNKFHLNFYCSTPKLICSKFAGREKYINMKGVLTSIRPVVKKGRSNIFEIKMENGDTLYYSTPGKSPFESGGLNQLKQLNSNTSLEGQPIIEGSVVRVDKVLNSNVGYKFKLSTGNEVFGKEFRALKAILPYIPIEEEVNFVKMINSIRVEKDQIEDRFLISIQPTTSANSLDKSPLQPFIIFNKNKASLIFKIYYQSSDWLFVNSVLVKAGKSSEEYRNLEFKRNNNAGTIWEWYSTTASPQDLKMLKKVVKSDGSIVRFYGKNYYTDREIDDVMREKIGNIVSVYNMLNGR